MRSYSKISATIEPAPMGRCYDQIDVSADFPHSELVFQSEESAIKTQSRHVIY